MSNELKIDSISFSQQVEQLAISDDIGYIDALIAVCDEHEVAYDEVSKHDVDGVRVNLITTPLKDKIEAECSKLRLIKGKKASPSVLDFL